MKKIGIVTLYGLCNYGNRLQNYASQQYFKKAGFETCTIINDDLININKESKIVIFKRKIKFLLDKEIRFASLKNKEREKSFISFEKMIKEYHVNNNDIKNLKDQFDYFAVGSDQVWNPWCMESKDWYFLDFCNNSQKIPLSPSIGINELPDEYNQLFKEKLNSFNYLACREYEGSQIISRLTGKDVETVIDPTMMLTTKEWDKVIKKPDFHKNEKYVLLYFLGELTNENKKVISTLEKRGYKIINILDISSKYYVCGPDEFVWLIKHASLMITDSFHGCVFSILYHTPFISFNRKGSLQMNCRINTLLKKFNFEERMFNDNFDIEKILYQDFSKVEEILDVERNKFINFIKCCMEK